MVATDLFTNYWPSARTTAAMFALNILWTDIRSRWRVLWSDFVVLIHHNLPEPFCWPFRYVTIRVVCHMAHIIKVYVFAIKSSCGIDCFIIVAIHVYGLEGATNHRQLDLFKCVSCQAFEKDNIKASYNGPFVGVMHRSLVNSPKKGH